MIEKKTLEQLVTTRQRVRFRVSSNLISSVGEVESELNVLPSTSQSQQVEFGSSANSPNAEQPMEVRHVGILPSENRELAFVCNECPAQFNSIPTLASHLEWHKHERIGNWEAYSKEAWRAHIDEKTILALEEKYLNPKARPLLCPECHMEFPCKLKLDTFKAKVR